LGGARICPSPTIIKPDGKGKLSKRDGDRLGFPVFPLQWKDPKTGEISSGYKESGYFPEAFVNILAFLGWNPGTEQELFTMEELIEAFSIDRIGKSGSKFDFEKAKWYNHQYLINKSDKELADLYVPYLDEKNITTDKEYIVKVCSLIKERANFISEFWDQSCFFFEAPQEYDAQMVKKRWKENSPQIMNELKEVLLEVDDFSSENTEMVVKDWINIKELGMGIVMSAFRLSIVGAPKGPHLFDIIGLLGKDETVRRIDQAVESIHT